jgi:hypothetical protein
LDELDSVEWFVPAGGALASCVVAAIGFLIAAASLFF